MNLSGNNVISKCSRVNSVLGGRADIDAVDMLSKLCVFGL